MNYNYSVEELKYYQRCLYEYLREYFKYYQRYLDKQTEKRLHK